MFQIVKFVRGTVQTICSLSSTTKTTGHLSSFSGNSGFPSISST